MANKHQELKSAVKGRGLDALKERPPLEETSSISEQAANNKDIKTIEKLPALIELRLSPDEVEIVRELSSNAAEYLVVWRAFTSVGEEQRSVFTKGEIITFNIDCSAMKILSQVKAPFSLEVISFDMRSQHSQALYCFEKEDKIPFENFRVQFQVEAVLSGIFTFRTLLMSKETESFHVHEGTCFRVI